MEGFTLVDGGVAAVVIISALLAYARGFVREVMSIFGWVAAAVLAFVFAAQAEPLVKEIPYLDQFLAESCELSILVAFVAVLAVGLVIVSIFTPIFSGLVQGSALGGVDNGAGFLFGAARGVLLVAIAFLAYEQIMVNDRMPMVDDSRSAAIFASLVDQLAAQTPENAIGWIEARYEELVSSCAG